MRHFNPVDLIHCLLQLNAQPALGDSKPDRLQRLNRQATLLYDQALREAVQYSPAISGKLSDIQIAAIAARVTAELERVNLVNIQQFNAVFRAIEDWQPNQKGQAVRKVLLNILPQARQKQELQVICQD